jgi:hypothetical protein
MSENQRITKQVSLEDFIKAVDIIKKDCESWLTGALTSKQASEAFDAYLNQCETIVGYSNFPDDYDWSQIPEEFASECESAIELRTQFNRVVHVAKVACEQVQSRPVSEDTILRRAYHFGQSATSLRLWTND